VVDDDELEVIVERSAGLDVHKDIVAVTVRVPGPGGVIEKHQAEFATFTDDLCGLRDWLVALGVTRVGMEATGVYWKPVFYVLEEDFECWLLNARHMHNVPGRKTDMADSDWICRLVRFGLVRPSFVPAKPIRELRNLTRYRRTRIEERTRETQRLDKVLQDAGVKLSSVASDITGRSGRDMLNALVTGTRDPEVLAELARGRLREKLPQLQAALKGRFGPNHALVVGEILAHIDDLDESIGRLQVGIDELIAPFAEARDRICTIPGVDTVLAEAIIARRGKRRARKAVGHSILIGCWHILHNGDDWNDLGGDYFDRRQDPQRLARRKLNELRSLGWTITDNPDGTTTIAPAA